MVVVVAVACLFVSAVNVGSVGKSVSGWMEVSSNSPKPPRHPYAVTKRHIFVPKSGISPRRGFEGG